MRSDPIIDLMEQVVFLQSALADLTATLDKARPERWEEHIREWGRGSPDEEMPAPDGFAPSGPWEPFAAWPGTTCYRRALRGVSNG